MSIVPPSTGSGTNAPFALVLAPVDDARIVWKPRSRDTRREKAVFYAEVSQLYAPSAGVIATTPSGRPSTSRTCGLIGTDFADRG